jgi:AAA15 family ATPase/GTPase
MIKSIKISNFKSIQEETVCFGSFNALVGVNGVGKTNIVNALLFVRNMVIGQQIQEAYKRIAGISVELFYKHNIGAGTSFVINLIKEEIEYALTIQLEMSTSDITQTIVIKSEKLEQIAPSQKIIYDRKNSKIVDVGGKPIPLNIENSQLVIALYAEPIVKSVKNLFHKLYIPTQSIMDERALLAKEFSGNLSGILMKLKHNDPQGYINFQKIIGKLIPSFNSVVETILPSDGQKLDEPKEYLVLIREKEVEGSLSTLALSAGDIRTLFIVARAIGLNSEATFVIEEIENGVHPKRISDLIYHLNTISKVQGAQIIFTTHSPVVINCLNPTEVIFVSKDNTKGTKVRMYKEQKVLAHIQDVLNNGGQLSDYLYSQL